MRNGAVERSQEDLFLRASCQSSALQDICHQTLRSKSSFIQSHYSEKNLVPRATLLT